MLEATGERSGCLCVARRQSLHCGDGRVRLSVFDFVHKLFICNDIAIMARAVIACTKVINRQPAAAAANDMVQVA